MKSKSLRAFTLAAILLFSTLAMPLRAYAFDESAISLNIDTSTIEVRENWQEIKNAALIHLIAQKFKKCISIGQVILNQSDTGSILGGTVWPRTSQLFGIEQGVLDKGNVFKTTVVLSGDLNTNLGVGPWMSSIFGKNNGEMKCNSSATGGGNLFDMFVYIYKNYRVGMSASDISSASSSVTEADRLKIVCNKDDLTKPGLLTPANWYGTPTSDACNSTSFSYYTGVSVDEQLAYISKVYEEMRVNSGNPYIVTWDNLGYYNGVDGFYLYSNDFETQCGSASFSKKKGNESGYIYKAGFEVTEKGKIRSGYYEIKSASDTARTSFVADSSGNKRQLTCQDLVDEMNEHIKEYVQFVNYETFNRCSTEIRKEINNKTDEIDEKYIENENATDEELEDARAVLDEYSRIMRENEYVATTNSNGEEELKTVSAIRQSAMPETYIWTCRSHLPFIDVVVVQEADLKTAIEYEFKSYCHDALDVSIAWIVCPILQSLSEGVDGLSNTIDEFF